MAGNNSIKRNVISKQIDLTSSGDAISDLINVDNKQ